MLLVADQKQFTRLDGRPRRHGTSLMLVGRDKLFNTSCVPSPNCSRIYRER